MEHVIKAHESINAIPSMHVQHRCFGVAYSKEEKEKKEKEKFSHRSGTSGDVDAAKLLAVE